MCVKYSVLVFFTLFDPATLILLCQLYYVINGIYIGRLYFIDAHNETLRMLCNMFLKNKVNIVILRKKKSSYGERKSAIL